MRVSIVDDHPIVRDAVGATVSFLCPGCVVASFGELESFLAARDAGPAPDIILLDLLLPGHEGVSSVLSTRETYPDVPIVVFSGVTDPATVMAALDAGAMSVIPKTAAGDDLIGAIRVVLDGGYYVPEEMFANDGMDATFPARGGNRRQGDSRSTDRQELEGLTERQQHVLRLILRGAPNKSIAAVLELSENTVKSHVSAILRALGVRNRTQAVLAAHRLGLTHRLRQPGDR